MPDVSIAISAQDSYSSAIKNMAQITKSFSKDMDEMEETLHKLNTNKYSLKLDADAALKELKALEKQFAETGDEADGLKAQMAKANYDRRRPCLQHAFNGSDRSLYGLYAWRAAWGGHRCGRRRSGWHWHGNAPEP